MCGATLSREQIRHRRHPPHPDQHGNGLGRLAGYGSGTVEKRVFK